MLIRKATPADSKVLYDLLRDLAEYEELLPEFVATEEGLKNQIFDPSNSFDAIIVEDEGQVVGMAIYYISFVTFLAGKGLFLEDLYVPPKYRGKGYGKGLLKYLAKLSLEIGCVRMEWNVLKNNKIALDFYDSLKATYLNDWVTCRMELPAMKDLAK